MGSPSTRGKKMQIDNEFAADAAVTELEALTALAKLLDEATLAGLHSALRLVNFNDKTIGDLDDILVDWHGLAVAEREAALSTQREQDVGEIRHRASLR
jgi:hypothetical protein